MGVLESSIGRRLHYFPLCPRFFLWHGMQGGIYRRVRTEEEQREHGRRRGCHGNRRGEACVNEEA